MKRLRDESSSDFVKSLLDSAALDAPAPGVEDRALQAAEREVMLPKTWPKGWVFGGTIVGIGALLLLLGQAYQGGKSPAAPASVAAPAVSTGAPPATSDPTPSAPPSANAPAPTTVTSVAPSASAAAPASIAVHAPSAPTPSAAPSTSAEPSTLGLRDELALIDEARTELAAGAAASALATLSRYDARYANGLLREEATAVRVEALFAAGRTAEARAVGSKFLAEHPSSTHAQHVKSLLEAHAP